MFWLIFWLLSLLIFLIFPAVCVDENRRRWVRRFRECRWNVDRAVAVSAPASGESNQQRFHYVLSKAQEDEIRESFLLEKIKNYTQELSEDQIERPESSGSSVEQQQEESQTNVENQTAVIVSTDKQGDIEEGPSSSADDEKAFIEEHVAVEKNQTEPKNPEYKDTADIEKGAVSCETMEEKHEESKEGNENHIPINVTGETEIATTTDQGADDCISDTGSSDGEMMEVVSFNGDDDGLISIPVAGECRHDVLPENVSGTQRKEPNGCAICLCPFEVADQVTWSSNPLCQHVFHQECIKGWLMASGRKFLKRQRREQRRTGNLSYDSDPISKITGFPMLCPCCRQHFIMPEEEESVDEKAAGNAPEGNDATMGDTEALMVAAS